MKTVNQCRLSQDEIKALTEKGKTVFAERTAYYERLVGVKCGRITVRHQKTRWGSCSSKGNLNFNCLLLLCPEAVLDSVVVHELCHILQMNHSEKFYKEVYRVMPDYDARYEWLKTNGKFLIAKL